jgi:hypothetical protein
MLTVQRAARLLLLPVLAPLAAAQFEVVPQADGSLLRWERGATVHTTPAQIRDLRCGRVDSSAFAAWNEEQPGQPLRSFFALSLDGQTVQSVKETRYELALRRLRFDPAAGEPEFSDSPLALDDGGVYIVQYHTQPLLEYSTRIAALGGEVFDFVERHAHIVRMDAEARASVGALPFVRAVVRYQPEFRVDPEILALLRAGGVDGERRYNVQVFLRGLGEQLIVAERIAALGGRVDLLVPEGFRFEATMTPQVLAQIASLDQVRFIDAWSAPEDDMDLVRNFGGANHVETIAGLTGQGVRVEVLDSGCDVTHPNFNAPISHGSVPVGSHGTCTAGIVAASGTASAQARGMLPSAQLIAAYYSALVGGNRYTHTAELVNPTLNYKAVLQSNSWGSSLTTSYTTISAEMDDIIVDYDFTILQSQSNAGSQSSRPQAWSKNIVSIGGIRHENTSTYADDSWGGGASIGPAADGRLKPDLAFFYDDVYCNDVQGGGGYSSGNYNSGFGGTSAATPITAGHFGLFFQMWHQGLFGNPAGTGTVFESRPHFTLAKAAMINTATAWNFSGAGSDLSRAKQGFGHANVRELYDRRTKTFYVDQTDTVTNLGLVSYNVNVASGEPDLRVTLVYRDNQGAVSSSQHRKNDLTLVVRAPNGTAYYGNNGLTSGLWSSAGGSPNTVDTVENVFLQNPASGTWVIEVRGDNINTDPATGAPSNSSDFALWATGVTSGPVCPQPQTYCAGKLTSGFTLPSIGFTGSPRVSTGDFVVTLSNALPNKTALVFYGFQPHNAPFHGGLMCAQAPTVRSPLVTTNPASAAQLAVSVTPAMVGTTRYYQWWFRDAFDSFGDGLSNALETQFCE